MNEEALQEMQGKKKVRDRLTENPEDNSYINTMSLPDTRIWIRKETLKIHTPMI